MLSKWVENTVGKREISPYKQFLLFPWCSKGLIPRGVKRCHLCGTGLKAFTDDKIDIAEMVIFLSDRVLNIVGKRKIAGSTSTFSCSHNVFKSLLLQGHLKSGIVRLRVKATLK